MKRSVLLGVLASAAFLLNGCHTGGAYQPVNTTKYDVENKSNFVLMDAGAQRSITASNIQETRLQDGRLQVVANVRNREERRIQVQIQCEFKDVQGFTIDSTPWNTLILTERSQESIRFVSMNPQATLYTVRVREAR